MQVTFYGAVREVTGSMHLLDTQDDRILMDCGLFQGRRKDTAEKNRVMPFDPAILTNVILSHAHIDHSGRLPLLLKKNFNGRIFSTRATKDACAYLLPDSAHIQESDAQYLNYKTVRAALSRMKNRKKGKNSRAFGNGDIKKLLKKNSYRLNKETIDELIKTYHLKGVEPLYHMEDAESALNSFEGIPYRRPVTIGNNITCTFYEAGHILGSAVSIIKYKNNGQPKTLCYTGDIGRFDKPILRDPALNFAPEDQDIDLLIMESTYGDREHEPVVDLKPRLKKALVDTFERGGSVLIPSFAYGRTQELLYFLHELYNEGDVPKMPIYVDSPLATNITTVFGEHPEVYDAETHETFLKKGMNPFFFDKINFVESVEASMKLMREKKSHVVISASGMCEAGRILHHLRYKIHNPNNTILIVGYMANHTLGRRILDQGTAYAESNRAGDPPLLKFLNKEYPLKAHVEKIGGFSAHGDKNEMLRFLTDSNLNVKKIAVVHGEEDQSNAFAGFLNGHGFQTVVPRMGETLHV